MAVLGSIHAQCPACEAPLDLPLTQTGCGPLSITVTVDLGAVRKHVAAAHPKLVDPDDERPREHPEGGDG